MSADTVNTTHLSDAETVARLGITQPIACLVEQGKPLRNFQLLGRRHLLKAGCAILSLDKGLGKTLTILSIFEGPEVNADATPGFTVIIFTTERGMGAWTRDLALFPNHSDKFCLVLGDKGVRQNLWRNSKARYFICTYASFLSDAGARVTKRVMAGSGHEEATPVYSNASLPKWVLDGSVDGVVCDEFHRVFRRRQSATFKLFQKLRRSGGWKKLKFFIPMSGSAVDRDPSDLWPALHLCDPNYWGSFWKYVYTWCEIEENGFGRTIAGPMLDRVDKWRDDIRPRVFHRTKKDVGDQMPPKNRIMLDVTPHKWEMELHDSLLQEQFAEVKQLLDNGEEVTEFIFASNKLAATHKVRLSLICPKALNPILGVGSGIESIADDALEGGVKRYGLFTPFKAPLPHLAEYLTSRGAAVYTLQGGIGLEEQERRLEAWRLCQATVESPAVILSTTKYAESWEIPEASYGYSLGYEWVREDNIQAEDRLHRLISLDPVFFYYVRHLGTYEEDMLERLIERGDSVAKMFANWVRSHIAQ